MSGIKKIKLEKRFNKSKNELSFLFVKFHSTDDLEYLANACMKGEELLKRAGFPTKEYKKWINEQGH